MTTDQDTMISPPERGWTREHSHNVIDRFATGEAPYHMCDSDQLALLLQIFCKELQALSNEVVGLQSEAEILREQLAKEVRTERLVVVHPDDGRELVYTERVEHGVALRVAWLPETDERRCEAVMDSNADTLTADANLHVSGRGEIVAMMSADTTTHGAVDGSLYVEHALTGDGRELSEQVCIDAGRGLTYYRDHALAGIARFEMTFPK